ncbi:hypothetical protein PUR71_36570 [Streptomyces sp. SP17BM10]|uniref:DUF6542 domain-containing protein n=1 Tax=Streptomyces sp. SP17BM10 TaxID=3002530 RepID=UPI002E7A070C|nr:DUF6542 domain-containing protein [Streptomyces sp. SP17BM10]MEE1788374.1 hypothetical protein [Streptomyces sp. SP17BM10]
MAGQRARTPYQEAGPRPDDAAVPAQRSRSAGAGAGAGEQAAASGSRSQRANAAARRKQQAQKRGSLVAVVLAIGLPLVGAVADELGGPGVGIFFAVAAVLGTGLAALLCSPAGRWWVVTGAPLVVLVTASATEYVFNGDKYQDTKQLGTGALRWVVGAFPVMAAAVAAALVVVVVKAVVDRRQSGGRPPEARAGGGTPEGNRRSRRG